MRPRGSIRRPCLSHPTSSSSSSRKIRVRSLLGIDESSCPTEDDPAIIPARFWTGFFLAGMQARCRRRRMRTVELLEQAISTSQELGYRIRYEWLGGSGGGACEFAGRKWLFVDLALSAD